MRPHVHIVTWCRAPQLLYGSLLTFASLRIGFPDAQVTVIENATPAELRRPILDAAQQVGARVVQLEQERPHWSLIEGVVMHATAPVVFLDPDLIFWRRADLALPENALMAGRLLPGFMDDYADAHTMARLHSSYLCFPDPSALQERYRQIQMQRPESGSLFEPRMMPGADGWRRWDTAASLHHALGEASAPFSEAQLDTYDHLFCGSHLPLVADRLDAQGRDLLAKGHAQAINDPMALRGSWRAQEAYFQSRAVA